MDNAESDTLEHMSTQQKERAQEARDFTEEYLKMLMDTLLNIKDKEKKIDKILGILSEIET